MVTKNHLTVQIIGHFSPEKLEQVLDVFSQVILIVSSAVGGNLIAHDVIQKEDLKANKNKGKTIGH